MEKEFNRVRTAPDIIVSAVLLVLGCVLVILPTSTSVNIVGFFLIFAAIILFLILRSGYKLAETGEIFRKKEKYFAQSMKESVLSAVSSAPENLKAEEEDKGNGLRIDTFYNTKTGKAYCRVYEYIPYRYEPCSPFYEYTIDQVEKLIK